MNSLSFQLKILILGFLAPTLLASCQTPKKATGDLLINEFIAKKSLNNGSEGENLSDWLEIYNPGNKPIDMAGMYISVDTKGEKKVQISSENSLATTVPSKSHLVFILDGGKGKGILNLDEKIKKDSSIIRIYEKDGKTLVDQVEYGTQIEDISYGRSPDGSKKLKYFMEPTKGQPNKESSIKGISNPPSFSVNGGFYKEGQTLELSANGRAKIYYTTNGALPKAIEKHLYKAPLILKGSTAIRAIVVEEDYIPSPVASHTYIIDESIDLTVVCLITDPDNLFDENKGLYHNDNMFEDWERPAHVEYFTKDKKLGFGQDIGIKLQGNYGRNSPKKSFHVMAKSRFGPKNINYKIFDDRPHDVYEGFALRADGTYAIRKDIPGRLKAGDRVKNELITKMVRQWGSPLQMQSYHPAILFINGEFWGLFNVMERKGKDFMERHYGFKNPEIINPHWRVHDNYEIPELAQFRKLLKFCEEKDLTQKENYAQVTSMLNIPEFIDVLAVEIWHAKGDINRNSRMFREKPDGEFHTLLFDHDHWKWDTMNILRRVYKYRKPSRQYLFRLLAKGSPDFRHDFINRTCDLMNTVAKAENINAHLDTIYGIIEPYVNRDREFWKERGVIFEPKGAQLQWVRDFAATRPPYMYKHLRDIFHLPGPATVKLEAEGDGSIKVSTAEVSQFPWHGGYMQGVPIPIRAIPAKGYVFKGWADPALPANASLILNLQGDFTLKAIFEKK